MLLANQNLIIDQEKLTRYLSVESRWTDMVFLCSEDERRFLTIFGEDYRRNFRRNHYWEKILNIFFSFSFKSKIYIQGSAASRRQLSKI